MRLLVTLCSALCGLSAAAAETSTAPVQNTEASNVEAPSEQAGDMQPLGTSSTGSKGAQKPSSNPSLDHREHADDAQSSPAVVKDELGLDLSLGTGLNICVPRGTAECTDLVPGPYVLIGFQYRFWRMGVSLSYATGRHFPIGTGAEQVVVSTDHATLDFLGYLPGQGSLEPYLGLGLGYGNVAVVDDKNDARVEWSSIWQSFRVSGGLRGAFPESMTTNDAWFWALESALYLHQGGERCVFYNAQGACRLSDEFSGGEADYASTLELGAKMGWQF